jgi:hypothetical protein
MDTSDWKSSCESAETVAVTCRSRPSVTTCDGVAPGLSRRSLGEGGKRQRLQQLAAILVGPNLGPL